MIFMIKQCFMWLIEIIDLAILIRCLLSFVPNLRYNKFGDIIYKITDPVIVPCRSLLEKAGLGNSMIDLSPMLAYLFLQLLAYVVVNIF